MNISALRCRLPASGDEALEVSHWDGATSTLAERQREAVYLVVDDALADLRLLRSVVTDRGQRHPARPLSKLLLRQPRVPSVRALFKSGRQVARSIRALLQHATRLREQKAYVVGVPRAIYEDVAARWGRVHRDSTTRARSIVFVPESMDPEDVPPALEQVLTGTSEEMHQVRQRVMRAAREDFVVLVQGDTGTGKEVVARAIRDFSPTRSQLPFVAVNCGAIPQHLFESDVFGYVGGAFTSAHRYGSEGLWRAAKGGTLFLDEIGDLAPDHQVKILRALEERAVRPVGGTTELPVRARVVAATKRDLYAMTERGEFREDLYYRIAAFVIHVPPLRDRPKDIAELAATFWREVAPRRPPLCTEVAQELQSYRLQGNARELRNLLTSLHAAFPKSVPSVERLRAVARVRVTADGLAPGAGPDDAVRRLECLRHLRRARSAVGTVQRIARDFSRKDSETSRRIAILSAVGGCLSELQLLGIHPERFEKLATFEDVHRLAGGVAAFQSLLSRNDPDALRYSKKELADEATVALKAVAREEERILKSL